MLLVSPSGKEHCINKLNGWWGETRHNRNVSGTSIAGRILERVRLSFFLWVAPATSQIVNVPGLYLKTCSAHAPHLVEAALDLRSFELCFE